jgi:hypothetical protein
MVKRYSDADMEAMYAKDGPDLLADLAEAAWAWLEREDEQTRYSLSIATGLYWKKFVSRTADSADAAREG